MWHFVELGGGTLRWRRGGMVEQCGASTSPATQQEWICDLVVTHGVESVWGCEEKLLLVLEQL